MSTFERMVCADVMRADKTDRRIYSLGFATVIDRPINAMLYACVGKLLTDASWLTFLCDRTPKRLVQEKMSERASLCCKV